MFMLETIEAMLHLLGYGVLISWSAKKVAMLAFEPIDAPSIVGDLVKVDLNMVWTRHKNILLEGKTCSGG